MSQSKTRPGIEFRMKTVGSEGLRLLLRFVASSLMDNVYYIHCGEDVLAKVTIDSKLREPIALEVFTPLFTTMDLSNALGIVRKIIKDDEKYAKMFPGGKPPYEVLPSKYVYTIVDVETQELPTPTPTWDSLGELLAEKNNRALLNVGPRYMIAKCHIVMVETLPAETLGAALLLSNGETEPVEL